MSDSLFAWPLLVLLACAIASAILWITVRRNPPKRVVTLERLEQLLYTMSNELEALAEHEWNDAARHALEGRRHQVKLLIAKVQRGDL